MDALEARVQKGKIPRRRYKVQKKTLEMRLSTLSRDLAEVRQAMRQSGGHHADLMRQLEVAETEINDVEANVKTIDARQSRGEVSTEAYRKLMGDYQRKKEKAETTINGILLRLREETR
jgi:septal ring factor EnvC (AmiA/AmiB activator)